MGTSCSKFQTESNNLFESVKSLDTTVIKPVVEDILVEENRSSGNSREKS
jgi:hypothetical protein